MTRLWRFDPFGVLGNPDVIVNALELGISYTFQYSL